eukprot:1158924-Pelagomonas_calceolata.AAC.8
MLFQGACGRSAHRTHSVGSLHASSLFKAACTGQEQHAFLSYLSFFTPLLSSMHWAGAASMWHE